MQFKATTRILVCVLVSVFTMLMVPVLSFAQNTSSIPPEIANKPNFKVLQSTGGQPAYQFTGSNGQTINCMIIPGSRPPAGWEDKVETAVTQAGVQTAAAVSVFLPGVPAFDWCYGCTPTSSSMLMGYYDRHGYPNFYTGPTNGGVVPLDNSVWGYGENPLSASHNGLDGRVTYGHVDDYWDPAGGTADPYVAAGRSAHADDSLADFMGTSIGGMANGSTYYYYYGSGDPYYPDTDKDVSMGIATWLTMVGEGDMTGNVFNQLIQGQGSDPAKGFTFADYKAEIDAGRPVLIHVVGHTMLGVGYDLPNIVYLHTTWDHTHPTSGLTTHMMTWGGSFQSMQHKAVTVLHLNNPDGISPTVIDASPTGTGVNTNSTVTVSFSEPMDETATEAAFSISPSVDGVINWLDEGATLQFIPDTPLANETTYTVTVTTGAKDLAGNILASQYQWDFTTGIGYRADGLVYDAIGATYLGNDIYNVDGASQTVSRTITLGGTTTFYVRMQNDGINPDWLTVKGIAGSAGWTITYINSADGADITADILDGTWSSLSVEPNCIQAIKVVVTADASVPAGTSFEIPLEVSSWWNPGEIDVVKIIPTVNYSYKPDALAYQDSASAYIGDGIYNTTGQWQTETHQVISGGKTTYYASYQNDGFKTDKIKLTGTAGNSLWTVKYFDSSTDTDITTEVTSTGWTSVSLLAGESGVVRIEVTPALTVPNGTTHSLYLTTASVTATTLSDVAKFITTAIPNYQPDALVQQALSGLYIGDGIYNTTGLDQSETREIWVRAKTTYYVRGQNDGNIAQKLVFKGSAAPTGWTIKYTDSSTGNDITADVTGAGWQTASNVPISAARSIKIEVTPGITVALGSFFNNLVTVSSTVTETQTDTVECVTSVPTIYRSDVLPYQAATASYIGNNIYNATGLDQVETRTINAGASTTYYARIQNDGNVNESMTVFGPAGDASWSIKYIDSSTGNDITADVTGSGWTTAVITRAGGVRSMKIIITTAGTLPSASVHELLLTARSNGDISKTDTGKFQTTIR